MSRHIAFLSLLAIACSAFAAEPAKLSVDAADARLRRAYSLARESNDSSLVERVLERRDLVRRSFARQDPAAAERLIRDAEEMVGLDPGGKSMFDLPIAQIAPKVQAKLDSINEQLAAAMKTEDVRTIVNLVAEQRNLLGDSAGLPSARERGAKPKTVEIIKPLDIADLFVKVIEAEPRLLKALSSGMPGSETQPRAYASIVEGCAQIRPLLKQHHKDKLKVVDTLVQGCCKAMIGLQLADGHFKFPDLRGRNLVLGDAIDKLVDKDANAVKNGWLIEPFPDGSSQLDAAECGIALLHAGSLYKNADWTKAGLSAADWSGKFPVVPGFHFNACSVSLLCAARKVTGEKKYFDMALRKYEIGLAVGMAVNGRLMNPESARTTNHLLLIRALHDLLEASPAESKSHLFDSIRLAMKSLIDEAETLGVPTAPHTIQELARHGRLLSDAEPRVRALLDRAATNAIDRCGHGRKIEMAVPLSELAAVAGVGEE